MNSLKSKFDDYREEPQQALWQKLLQKLDTEMPVRKKRRYLFWLLPLILVTAASSLWLISEETATPAVSSQRDPIVISPEKPIVSNVVSPKEKVFATIPFKPTAAPRQPVSYKLDIPEILSPVVPAIATPNMMNQRPTRIPNPIYNPEAIPGLKPDFLLTMNTKTDFLNDSATAAKEDSIKKAATNTSIKEPPQEKVRVLEIYYGSGISNIILKDPLSTFLPLKQIEDNKNLRNSISKSGFSFTTGFGVKINLTNSLRAKTGFYFTQINQTLYYDAKPSQCSCGHEIKLRQLDPKITDANTSNMTDTISKGDKFTANNKYSLQEIPLVFEYTMPMAKHKNFNTVVNFGISYMFMQGLNIKMPDADNVGFVTIADKTANADIFPSYKDAFNVILGYGISYYAARNVEWKLTPQFKMAFTSLSNDRHWFREYPWQFHIGVGVGKRF